MSGTVAALEVVHIVSTFWMVATIWFVQIVHYPLFRQVGDAAFVRYEEEHVQRITWVVAPFMLVELGSAVTLLPVLGVETRTGWIGLGLLAVIWLSTFLVQVPLHERLRREPSADTVRKLVVTNWVRTVAWSGRGVLVTLELASAYAD